MSTVVLTRVPRDLGYHDVVRAICRHLDVPVSTETRWHEGHGDIHIDVPGRGVDQIRYAVELYVLVLGIEYRILEDMDRFGSVSQGPDIVPGLYNGRSPTSRRPATEVRP